MVSNQGLRKLEVLEVERKQKNEGMVIVRHFRKRGQAADALELVAPHADFEPENIQPPRIECFLEAALCRAAQGQVRDALKRLRFAETHAEGLALMRVLLARADLFLQADGYKKAIGAYENALSKGNQHYRPKRVSESEAPEPVPGTDQWRELRQTIKDRLAEARKQWDIARYGKGFAYYRIARRAERDGNYEYAVTVYELLARMVPDSVYADAAAFQRALLLEKIGFNDKADEAFRDFLRAEPLGLYRGEAWLHLGENALLRDLDTRAARRHFSRTLDWIRRVTERQRQIDLHIVPEKARDITAPPVQALVLNENRELVPADEPPEAVVNRQTADWYLDRLAWQAEFHLGFLEFANRDYDAALERWTSAFKRNEQLRDQHKSQLASFYQRLENACRGRRFIATPQEMKAFRPGKERLQLMLADFHALWLRWKPAERLYTDLLENHRLSDNQTAVVLRCLAQNFIQRNELDKAREMLARIMEKFPRSPAVSAACYRLAQKTKNPEQAVRLFRQAHSSNPNSKTATLSLSAAGHILWKQENFTEAREIMQQLVNEYPDTYWAQQAQQTLKSMEQNITMEEAMIRRMLRNGAKTLSEEGKAMLRKELKKIQNRGQEK